MRTSSANTNVAMPVASLLLALAMAGCATAPLKTSEAKTSAGENVYKTKCAGCHSNTSAAAAESHVPPQSALQQLSPTRILRALDFGVMMSTAASLTREERDAVATFLGKPGDDRKLLDTAFCKDRKVAIAEGKDGDWNGWSPTSDGMVQARVQFAAGFSQAQVSKLKLKWVFGFDGDTNAFAPPTVLGDNLFVGSAGGMVHALDRATGCVKWIYAADGPVRTAITVVPLADPAKHALLFGDQIGWFYSVEAESGKLLWKKKPEAHEATKLTGSPAIHDGIAYVPVASWEENRPMSMSYVCCTFRGSVVAYRIADGTELWKTYMIPDAAKLTGGKMTDGRAEWGPSGAGIWATPTIDVTRGRLYVTTGNNYTQATALSDAVVALEMANGKIVWSKQATPNDIFNGGCANRRDCPGPDFDFGSSVILAKLDGKDIVLAGQKSGIVYALDPDRAGAELWQQRVGKGGTNGGVQWGMAADGTNVYAAVSDVVRIRGAAKSPLDPSPNGVDPKVGGGLTALRIRDGEKVWYAAPTPCEKDRPMCSPGQPAAVAAMPGAVFAGSVDGHLRAYSTTDGKVIWDFDTSQDWSKAGKVVNGVATHGGSIDGAGPVVAGGMVFVESGYSRNGGQGGNALLAFGPQ